MPAQKPIDPAPLNAPKPGREPPDREGDVRHIIDKGLPPGIGVEDAIDPGSQAPATPADDRS